MPPCSTSRPKGQPDDKSYYNLCLILNVEIDQFYVGFLTIILSVIVRWSDKSRECLIKYSVNHTLLGPRIRYMAKPQSKIGGSCVRYQFFWKEKVESSGQLGYGQTKKV